MAIGDIWRITISGLIGADVNENVLHYRVSSGGGTAEQDAALLGDAWESDAKTEYLALLANQYTIKTLKIRGVTHPTVGTDRTVTGVGGVAGEISPTQVSALINLKTGAIGRSFMGKIYLPALAESSVSSGSIVPGQVTNIDTLMNEMLVVFSTGLPLTGFTLGVYSRKLGTIRDVVEWQVSQFAATQRRRRPGTGA